MIKHNPLPGRRKRTGLTQEELAHLAGVGRTAISRFEQAGLTPSARTMLALEVILGRSPRYLFPGFYAQVQDEVMRRAARLDRVIAKRRDAHSALVRKLLREMVDRNEPDHAV